MPTYTDTGSSDYGFLLALVMGVSVAVAVFLVLWGLFTAMTGSQTMPADYTCHYVKAGETWSFKGPIPLWDTVCATVTPVHDER
jgi:hypothetical protein